MLSLRGLDGFFASTRAKPAATLYAISRDANQVRLVCLASDDNGTTWHDYAVSEVVKGPYAIGGCREVTSDGWIIGSFTDTVVDPKDSATVSKVYFFKIRAGLPLPRQAVKKITPD